MSRLETIQSGGGGMGGRAARVGLRVLSVAWGLAWRVKSLTYALGLRRPRRLPVPVISIGNLAVGGTGKTPFTAWLAGALADRGRRPGILSRGYGPPAADVSGLSDEGEVLRHRLGEAFPQVEMPDRWRGGQKLLAEHPDLDVILLDDGFQHRRLACDLDIVLLDATCPFGYGHLLPRGRLREPRKALARAGLIVLTRTERRASADLATIRGEVAAWSTAPVCQVATVPLGLEVDGEVLPPEALAGEKVFAVSGLGNPAAYEAFLVDLGAAVVGTHRLPDHASLTTDVLAELGEAAKAAGARWVVITRKDAVKIAELPPAVAVLDVDLEVKSGEGDLWAALD